MKVVRSRKDRQCTERSYHVIHKGDKYLFASMPPWHDMNRSKKWHTIRACLRCAREFGLHTNETREQVCCCNHEVGEDHHPQCPARP